MIRDSVAKRYAQAAFEIARDRGTLDQWAADLGLLATVIAEPQASAFLSDTRVPRNERYRFLEKTLEGVDPLVLNLAKLLVAKGRVPITPQIVEAYRNLVDEHRGISHAEVITAVPLSDEEKRTVEEKLSELTGTRVIARLEVQPEIVGGLLVRVGDRLIDGSTVIGEIKGQPLWIELGDKRTGPLVLHERSKGKMGQKLKDLIYVKRIIVSRKMMEAVLKDCKQGKDAK